MQPDWTCGSLSSKAEWWLRQSAFSALAGAAADDQLIAQVLPTMLTMLVAETHTMPREGMAEKLSRLMRTHKADTPAGQQILAAHLQAVRERAILPGPRAGEGEYDIAQSSEVVLKEAPERALELTQAMQARLDQLTTGMLTKLVDDLVAALEKVPDAQRDALQTLLYADYRAALIGVGDFKKGKESFTSASAWGDDEFLLARTTFQLDALDCDYYRIRVLANQGFRIYLNGQPIETYIWWKDDPHYRKIMLSPNAVKLLRVGTNQLAVYAGSDYVKDVHVGQVDVYLEGLRKRDLVGASEPDPET